MERMKLILFPLLYGLTLSCHASNSRHIDRARELDQCRALSRTGDELTHCLILQHDWPGDSALRFGDELQSSINQHNAKLVQRVARTVRLQADSAKRDWERAFTVNLLNEGYDSALVEQYVNKINRVAGSPADTVVLSVATSGGALLTNLFQRRPTDHRACERMVDSTLRILPLGAREVRAAVRIVC